MATDAEIEEFIDYSWHPSEEEFVSPLTADQWEELLGDASFAETDAAKAVRCLLDYGEPATFQQLSIRYRAAMGRYRRWLTDAARTAGERFGVAAPSKDQFGMDEWWPLLYQTRNAGKPGAGIFEMQLRPEVVEAYRRIDEAERHERRAENVRQLQRIEQLERARQEERRRAAERAQAAQAARAAKKEQDEPAKRPARRKDADAGEDASASSVINGLHPSAPEPQSQPAKEEVSPAPEAVRPQAPQPPAAPAPAPDITVAVHPQAPAAPAPAPSSAPVPQAPAAPVAPSVPEESDETAALTEALATYLAATGDGHDILPGIPDPDAQDTGELDYATRYATRLASALALVREVEPLLTEADVARALGDESVERLQDVLAGRTIPTFAYVDALARTLFVSPRYLEAQEAFSECVPVFASLAEVCGRSAAKELASRIQDLSDVSVITEDARDRRTLVACRIGRTSCCLLTRASVSRARRRKEGADLAGYRKLAAELEAHCKANGIAFSHQEVTSDDFEALACGLVWPGWYCG